MVAVPYGSDWKYLTVPQDDLTDRSGASYDDSTWPVGSAPIGHPPNPPFDVLPIATTVPDGGLWVRKQMTGVERMGDLWPAYRARGIVRIYWDGVLIAPFQTVHIGIGGLMPPSPDGLLAIHLRRYVDTTGAVGPVYVDVFVPGLMARPPRRIFPRDDGLTGGAPRNYPPSKGVQSGIRTTGGYL